MRTEENTPTEARSCRAFSIFVGIELLAAAQQQAAAHEALVDVLQAR